MILITAHEGCENSPSNTISSVKAGIEAGADIVEVDVRSTKDGIAVLSHSSRIETVSGESISIADINFNELITMEEKKLIKFEHPDGKLTILEEVLDYIKGTGIIINLDVKTDGSIDPIVKAVKAHRMLNNVFISGCERKRASFFKHNYPEFQILLNIGTDLSHLVQADTITAAATIYRYASTAGCCGINIPYQFCSPEMVDFMHKRFLPVSVWTVDETAEMKKFIDMSVFSITTNRPRKLKRMMEEI